MTDSVNDMYVLPDEMARVERLLLPYRGKGMFGFTKPDLFGVRELVALTPEAIRLLNDWRMRFDP